MKRDWHEALKELFDGETVLRSKDLEQRALSRTRIREAMDAGELERIGRGLYALSGAEPSEHHSLVQVAKRVPHSAICLLSALRFHELTSQNPHEVWIAIGPKDRKPTLEHPSLKVVRYGDERFEIGLENHQLEGTLARYGVERFLYRLSVSGHADQFVLKGSMLFHMWNRRMHRPTRDLDLLGSGPAAVKAG